MSDFVTLVEMSPRDGLQNEKNLITTADKIELINLLSECGFSKIEATSFVSPKWVPQLGDASEVMAGISRQKEVVYSVLTPNLRGFENAVEANADEVAIFTSASEGFCQKNINCSIAESIERFAPIMDAAKLKNIPVRGYVSCVTDCPYDGGVSPLKVAEVSKALTDMGCFEVSLGDTIGSGTPEKVSDMLNAVIEQVPASKLAGHFHDTSNTALDNITVSLEAGLRVFDSSVGGLGGCPYAPGAKGNVATESVIELLHQAGYSTGLDLDQVNEVARFAKTLSTAS